MVARRHHYVPKCYLNSFSIENDRKKNLLVFDAIDRKHFKTAPDNVALERDFNTIDLEGHPPDAFEKAMASVESDIGPALTRIVGAKSLANENDRTLLLNLIGLLHIRNPRFREQQNGCSPLCCPAAKYGRRKLKKPKRLALSRRTRRPTMTG
jgi:Protein of unknown function (DUF4238)